MVAPIIIRFLFWLGLFGCIIAGIVFIAKGVFTPFVVSSEMILMGIGYLVLGPIVVRIYCEFLIIMFSINDTLKDIKDPLNRQQNRDD